MRLCNGKASLHVGNIYFLRLLNVCLPCVKFTTKRNVISLGCVGAVSDLVSLLRTITPEELVAQLVSISYKFPQPFDLVGGCVSHGGNPCKAAFIHCVF